MGGNPAVYQAFASRTGTQVQGKVFVSPAAHPELRLPATLDILNPRVDDGGLLRARDRLRDYGKAASTPV
jgi:hypothetical protein